ncbi:integral membrane sensor signal transduction histidine kinase [Paenibacillus curdlanolyticus YK9]|uniref:Integral membrane sensor signal transduction histidine kinase n=1 Tax=Paenibacillus curdlanolyticus YK9 TaxID=717606 RepID=E0IFF5_9BACL|nr:histidine kinase [Paenibacillus curdlanolyticus]EFM08931.1 integral membrane sensor signal transduction histidine kinase [Paenibacillus curdlanolyticus YK9]
MKHKKSRKLSSRFILLFSALALPLLLILFGAGHYAQKIVLTQVANSYQNLVNSNLHMIDRSLNDITTNMVYIVDHDENFQKFGRSDLTDSEYYFAQMELLQRNTAYRSYYHTVDMFYIYSRATDRLATTNVIPGSDHDQVKDWITNSLETSDARQSLMYQWSIVRIGNQHFLHRVVGNDTSNNTFIGALINVNTLKMALGNLDLREGGDVLFAGEDGTVLSDISPTLNKKFRLPAEKLMANTSFSFSDEGEDLFIITSSSPVSRINMAVVLPYSELLRGLKSFETFTYLLPLIVFLILLIYLYILRRIIYHPILLLLGAIRRTKDGDMEMKLPGSSITEFDIIHHTFNTMVDEIKGLKIGVYEERLNAQKAEMKHLQMQINPHFFLNTLNIIFQLADMKRFELVKKTVRHVVQYFRFMLNASRDTITVDQEIAHIRNYLEIQKMRYQESFEFKLDIAEELREAQIPSLIVQPFVENAMIHGMSVKGEPFTLHILAGLDQADNKRMVLEVKDSGKGVSPELLEALSTEWRGQVSEGNHIGIWNVKRRMSIRYGDQAAIVFFHNAPRGLGVRLHLPIEHVKEQDER